MKGRNRNYKYYHYDTKFKCGRKTFFVDKVHESFVELLNSYKISSDVLNLFKKILLDVFKIGDRDKNKEIITLNTSIAKLKQSKQSR